MNRTFLLSTLFLAATGLACAAVTETFSQTYPLAADGAIELDNVNGDVTITAWDRNEVALEAEKRGKTEDDLKRMTIEIDAQPAKLTIKTRYEKTRDRSFFGDGGRGSVRYTLKVPSGARLGRIEAVNSDIEVSGVRGPVNLETVNGRIEATGLAGDAAIESVNGSLRAEYDEVRNVRSVKLGSVNGQATVVLPKGASANVEARSFNGRTSVEQAIKLSRSGRRSLAGQIGDGAGPAIVARTTNGSISIREK